MAGSVERVGATVYFMAPEAEAAREKRSSHVLQGHTHGDTASSCEAHLLKASLPMVAPLAGKWPFGE